MKREIKKDEPEFQMFKDYWRLYTMYNIPEENDTYWSALLEDLANFNEKYNTKFAAALAMDLVSELERKYQNVHK